jgi:hypothetical protein
VQNDRPGLAFLQNELCTLSIYHRVLQTHINFFFRQNHSSTSVTIWLKNQKVNVLKLLVCSPNGKRIVCRMCANNKTAISNF